MSLPEYENAPTVFVSSVNSVMSYAQFIDKLFKHDTDDMEMMHAALGITGEAGEIADAVKKAVIYEKPIDRTNIVEELGDLRFYMQALMSKLSISEDEVLQSNANKLSKRYPTGGYSNKDAVERKDKIEEVAVEVCFCHDLEDGWYSVKTPTGERIERNHWKDMKELISASGWKGYWVGDVRYKPEDIEVKRKDKAEFNPNAIADWQQSGNSHVWFSPSNAMYVFSDEASQLDTTPYNTLEEAKAALGRYVVQLKTPNPAVGNWGLTEEQRIKDNPPAVIFRSNDGE
jgi:NTP pyrophosphatase (non-canonical NTP hydrolase)